MRTLRWTPLSGAVAALVVAACSSRSTTPASSGVVGTTARMTVQGTITSDSGEPLGRVSLVAGKAHATSEADGTYVLTGTFNGDRLVIEVAAPGFAPTVAVVPRKGLVTTYSLPIVLPHLTTTAIDGTQGGTTTVDTMGRQLTITIPYATLVQAGPLTLRTASYEPAWGPGLLQALSGGRMESVQSAGMLYVDVVDSLGTAVDVQAGQTFQIAQPAFSLPDLPEAQPLEAWDMSAAGDWSDPRVIDPPAAAPSLAADHFGYWSFDRSLQTACVIGHVRAQGKSAPQACGGQRVRADGPTGLASFDATDEDGSFCVAGGLSQSATIVIGGASRTVTMPAAAGSCAAPAGCIDIGEVDVSPEDCAPQAVDAGTGGAQFTCMNGARVPRGDVCNHVADCSDGSDEASCGDPAQCCAMTAGCPSETAAACTAGCCCCPTGQACAADLSGCAAAE